MEAAGGAGGGLDDCQRSEAEEVDFQAADLFHIFHRVLAGDVFVLFVERKIFGAGTRGDDDSRPCR